MSFWSPSWLARPQSETRAWLRTVEIWRDRCFKAERREEEWRSRALAAECKIEDMHSERLKLDKRIRNQRVALRQTWEIVEMRQNYMGSPASRAAYARLLKRLKGLDRGLAASQASPLSADITNN